jgi:hypothetical protein
LNIAFFLLAARAQRHHAAAGGGIEPTENWVNVALNKALAARNYKTAPTISGRHLDFCSAASHLNIAYPSRDRAICAATSRRQNSISRYNPDNTGTPMRAGQAANQAGGA